MAIPKAGGAFRCIIMILSLAASQPGSADTIRVAVASNFRTTLAAIAARFETGFGHHVVLISGSTGKHYAQIVNGAPFDAFFAADALRPERLDQEGRIVRGSRFTYAIGKLLLWSPDESLVDARGEILDSDRFSHLAIANPDLAPYGAAAREVLQALGLWGTLQGRLVRGENVGQAFQFVASGNAQLGFVAGAYVHAGQSFSGSTWEPPKNLYSPIDQQAVLLREGPAVRAFMEFVQGAEARSIIRASGYDLP